MSNFDLVEGEEILLRANLRKDRWTRYRCITCSLRCISTIYLAPICVPLYAFFGGPCRQQEADSFELILTNQNIHFRQMQYSCGFCCQATVSKVIPLNRIQDVALISDWVGDNCGVVDTAGEVYQLQIQTAAMGTFLPELCIVCIENPREFKKKVLEAKNRLGGESSSAGQSKALQTLAAAQPEDVARILAMLQRQPEMQPQPPSAV